jgi:hypothetical protein
VGRVDVEHGCGLLMVGRWIGRAFELVGHRF